MKKKKLKFIRFEYIKYMDKGLLFAMLALFFIGITAIYSASIYSAFYDEVSQLRYLGIQGIAFAVGVLVYYGLVVFERKSYLNWKMLTAGLIFVVATLCLVLLTEPILGASRWIPLGPVNFQPSELAKIVYVLFIAYWFTTHEKSCYDDGLRFVKLLTNTQIRQRYLKNKRFWQRLAFVWGTPLFITGVIVVLLILEPDNGSVVMILAAFTLTFFVSFVRRRYWRITFIVISVMVMGVLLFKEPVTQAAIAIVGEESHIAVRFRAWLDPFADYEGDGYQLANSYIAIAKGGVTGAGIGNGTQKQGFLPEGHTDFILANIAEEFGLVGILGVLAIFGFIILRSLEIAMRTTDKQAKLTVFGLITLFFIQVFWNAAGISGLLPMKGLTSPFLSYGGTSVVFIVIMLGLIQAIAAQTNYKLAKQAEKEALTHELRH